VLLANVISGVVHAMPSTVGYAYDVDGKVIQISLPYGDRVNIAV
jgi:hypothetical protein